MSLQLKPPDKKKSSSPPPSFSMLPNDITVSYLARIPRSYYPSLSMVSKTFKSLVSSTDLYAARSHLGNTEQCLYVCIWDYSSLIPRWFRLCINPNQTLPNSSSVSTKKTTSPVFVPIPDLNSTTLSEPSVAVVGSEIYVIGGIVDQSRSSRVRVLDCRTDTWRDAPSMNIARRDASSCVYDGKIYVLGGCKRLDEWAEVFDTKTQTWECLPDPGNEIRKCLITKITEMEGKIMFKKSRGMYFAYGTKKGKWEYCCGNESLLFSGSQCVVENVSYRFGSYCKAMCQWFDTNDEKWKEVKGLDSLPNKCKELVGCDKKLLFVWDKRDICNSVLEIWCAEIVLEKRNGTEVWGIVEWVGVVQIVPMSGYLLHCLAINSV